MPRSPTLARPPVPRRLLRPLPLLLAAAIGCEDVKEEGDDHDHGHEDLFTTVVLTFTPDDGGDALTFTWTDPESDGSPEIDPITLPDGGDGDAHEPRGYLLSVGFFNAAEDPPHDITPEIEDAGVEHLVLLLGSAVQGPGTGDNPGALFTHTYLDADDNGVPIGLSHEVQTLALGEGELELTLRHMPSESGVAIKTDESLGTVAADGQGALGGGVDVQVTFPVSVD